MKHNTDMGDFVIEFEKTKLDNVMLIKSSIFEDFRGEYIEIFNKDLYRQLKDIEFVQDDISVSTRHVLRGIHGDDKTWKLISCLFGTIYLVVINYDQTSKEFGKWQGFTLSEKNRHQVLVPPRHGNGHLVMSERAIFHYKQSTYYDPNSQFTIVWNDSRFKIWWPIKDPIISRRDGVGHFIE